VTTTEETRETDSGIHLRPYYTVADAVDAGRPGSFPYTRGLHEEGYRRKLWTMRQYSGFGTAAQTNERFHYLLRAGQTGLSTAFDLPTQMGLDSDHPRALGEVGRVGVAIDSLADMDVLLDGIPLDQVSTSMTINATASTLLVLYQLAAEKRGISPAALSGTVQNDILKEYAARGTYIYPPAPSIRLVTDLMDYAHHYLPNWNTISISGYHIREAGSTAAQEIAFTLSNAIAYASAAVDAGLNVDDFAPRLSFFFNAHNNFLEEVAKFRAARAMWAEIMKARFGACNPRSTMLRFHTQTGGSTLTAQQPLNNVVRVALQALAAVMGGTQSLHTNGFDEALALPSETAATLALRTQQIIANESGVPDVTDPLGGSYLVEHLTRELIEAAQVLMNEVEERGGAVAAIESGYVQEQIEESAYRFQRQVDRVEKRIVGVNVHVSDDVERVEIIPANPEYEREQRERLAFLRRDRDNERVRAALTQLEEAARGTDNVLRPLKAALAAYATVGEVSDVLRRVFGEYRPGTSL